MTSRLLIADSDASLRESYHSYFSNHGFDVMTVDGGLECLAQIKRFRPDVLLLEWELHWGGGAGVLAKLHEEKGAAIPVVVASDRRTDELTPFLTDNVVACVQKPFSLASVAQTLQQKCHGVKDISAMTTMTATTINSDDERSTKTLTPTSLKSATCPAEILDDLERIHLQLGLLEYRISLSDGMLSQNTMQLSELAENVKSIMERLTAS